MAYYRQTLAPAFLPLTLEEAKAHLRVVGTYHDSVVSALIAAAVNMAENYTWRPFVEQAWKYYLDKEEFTNYININKAPLIAFGELKYYNHLNVLTTLSGNNYQVDLDNDPARIKITTVPTVYDKLSPVELGFTCGYMKPLVPMDITGIVSNVFETIEVLSLNTPIVFSSVGSVTGISANRVYYAIPTATGFSIANVPNGTALTVTIPDGNWPTCSSYSPLPDAIKSALKLIIGHLFEHREDVVVGASVAELPMNSQYLLNPFKIQQYYELF